MRTWSAVNRASVAKGRAARGRPGCKRARGNGDDLNLNFCIMPATSASKDKKIEKTRIFWRRMRDDHHSTLYGGRVEKEKEQASHGCGEEAGFLSDDPISRAVPHLPALIFLPRPGLLHSLCMLTTPISIILPTDCHLEILVRHKYLYPGNRRNGTTAAQYGRFRHFHPPAQEKIRWSTHSRCSGKHRSFK